MVTCCLLPAAAVVAAAAAVAAAVTAAVTAAVAAAVAAVVAVAVVAVVASVVAAACCCCYGVCAQAAVPIEPTSTMLDLTATRVSDTSMVVCYRLNSTTATSGTCRAASVNLGVTFGSAYSALLFLWGLLLCHNAVASLSVSVLYFCTCAGAHPPPPLGYFALALCTTFIGFQGE